MTVRTAQCRCGAIEVRCDGEPARISVCHCNQCKRSTGSAFSYNATYDAGQVQIAGEARFYTRSSEEGYWVRHAFCPKCGSSPYYEIERWPGMISVPAGAFADPDFPAPTVQVYEEMRHAWLPPLLG